MTDETFHYIQTRDAVVMLARDEDILIEERIKLLSVLIEETEQFRSSLRREASKKEKAI